MALLLGDLQGLEQVELDSAGNSSYAGLAGLAGGEVADLLGFPRAGPVRAVGGGQGVREAGLVRADASSKHTLTVRPRCRLVSRVCRHVVYAAGHRDRCATGG